MLRIVGANYMSCTEAGDVIVKDKPADTPLSGYIINISAKDSAGNNIGILAELATVLFDPETNDGFLIPSNKIQEYVDMTSGLPILKSELPDEIRLKNWRLHLTQSIMGVDGKKVKYTKVIQVQPHHDILSRKLIEAINASAVELPADRYDFLTSKIRELEAGKATLATMNIIMDVIGVKIADVILERTITQRF